MSKHPENLLDQVNSRSPPESMQDFTDAGFKTIMEIQDLSFFGRPSRTGSAQLKAFTMAMDRSSLTQDSNEQLALARAAARFDPIVWDLIVKHLPPMHFMSYPGLLKICILTLRENHEQIKHEYRQILRPYKWGRKLDLQHSKYDVFVKDHFCRTYYNWCIVLGIIMLIVGLVWMWPI